MIEGPVMYSSSHSGQHMGNMASEVLDGSGTINPAALNTPVSVLPTPTSLTGITTQSPRGHKRSRSPDPYGDGGGRGYPDHDDRPKKRGRPPKERAGDSTEDLLLHNPGQPASGVQQLPAPVIAHPSSQQQPAQTVPATKQNSPTKPTASKSVVKALPTVRDHTTDQLNTEGDEYIPREIDDAGEGKVTPTGRLLGGREYKCRTFLVPNRGDKLFMLATECARILGYRDSYLLFNKNRSLYKIIATQNEKDDLIHQDILPYSYRSRQIAIVTAKSMFRQFGSRVVSNGRRVRDDYWEAKARKQGFTEEDMAGEKRPGAAKREAQAQNEAAAHAAAGQPHNDIVYSNGPGSLPLDAHGNPVLPGNFLPMINPAPADYSMHRPDYSNIPRPRQEISGPPYHDRGQIASMSEIMNQASHAADFNKALNYQQRQRGELLKDAWHRPKTEPVSSPVAQEAAAAPAISQQPMQSPHLSMSSGVGGQQQMLPPQAGQSPYQPQQHTSQPSPAAMRNPGPPQMHRASTMPYGSGHVSQSSNYGYPSSMWPQHPQAAAAQQSPMASHHSLPQYSPQTPNHSNHPQSPHPSQSPNHLPSQSSQQHVQASMQPQQMGYQMPGMSMQPTYGQMGGRSMYQQPQQSPHGYMQQSQPGSAGGTAGWAPQGGQQGWQGQGY